MSKIAIVPRSDQWNADDFMGGPRTFTIAAVNDPKAESPYDIALIEDDGKRAWRPPNSVLSGLAQAWGTFEREDWVGRRVTLYRDPTVRMGKDSVGGIRVSHISHISKPTTVQVTVSRGRKGPMTFQPLTEAPPITPATPEEVQSCTEVAELRAMWATATPEVQALITARKAELDATAPAEGDES